MNVNFVYRYDNPKPENRMLQIDKARICFRNFAGRGDQFNAPGKRNFCLVIDDEEIAQALARDLNEYGVGWNVKIRPPREEGDIPFMYLKVNVAFGERSAPAVYLKSGRATNQLSESEIGMLDDIRIASVDLDIRPFDGETRGGPFRSAYLQSIWVTQDLSGDRFASRYAEMNDDGRDEPLPF